jgi:hypothetical protein
MRPSRVTTSPSRASVSMTSSAWRSATTATMPTPQLKVRSISAWAIAPVRLSQPNTGGTSMAEVDLGRHASGSTRGMFSVRPPPVIWASP